MKVYIMTDLEGVAGVQDFENWCFVEGRYHLKAKEFLTKEVNAAIEGFLSGGATEILVADAHGPGAIDPELLHQKAELARNWPNTKSKYGHYSIDEKKFDFAAWVGQHPMAGTIGGHLSHTGTMEIVDQRVNGIAVGEFGNLVLIASVLGIRSIFASGCEAFCREAQDLVPGIETVAVKRGTQTEPGNHLPPKLYLNHNVSAIHLHPEEARRRIREGAKRAIERAQQESFGLAELPPPPYTKTIIIRGCDEHPPRIIKLAHPKSLIEMNRAPETVRTLMINPADPKLITLGG